MAGKKIAVKKYVVRLSGEERKQLEDFICKGRPLAHLATRARILLKADVSNLGEGWSDSRTVETFDTSIVNVQRARERLVKQGFEAALSRKYNQKSARPRTLDGVAESKLIALTCRPAPEGFAKWTLRLLEEKVVELNIVEKASDSTIGRTLKKRPAAAPQATMGDRACGQCDFHGGDGRHSGGLPKAARSRQTLGLSG